VQRVLSISLITINRQQVVTQAAGTKLSSIPTNLHYAPSLGIDAARQLIAVTCIAEHA